MAFSRHLACTFITLVATASAIAETVEPIRYGNMDQWVTRTIKESRIIGGKQKTIYEIAPNANITDGSTYTNMGGSPWATSNILAKVKGITKTSNAVFPDNHEGHGRCAKLTTLMENCKVIGIINIDVVVAGSIFTGRMLEPITSTSNPYAKMEMGIPFTKRPKYLQYDYRLSIPNTGVRTYSSGFGGKKTLQGIEQPEVFILLQRRWEDDKGNLYAKRVGTGRERFTKGTNGWRNNHRLAIHYGDITGESFYKPFMGLIDSKKSYHARNSKGKMVPVTEVGWDSADATPTHMLIMFSAASGEAYIGTLDLTMWVDNVALVYE